MSLRYSSADNSPSKYAWNLIALSLGSWEGTNMGCSLSIGSYLVNWDAALYSRCYLVLYKKILKFVRGSMGFIDGVFSVDAPLPVEFTILLLGISIMVFPGW